MTASRSSCFLSVVLLAAMAACTDPGTTQGGAGMTVEWHDVDSLSSLQPLQPILVDPPADMRLVMLGKELFNDVRLSKDNSVSCASCHDVGSGGDDGRSTSVGVGGQVGEVNSPTVLNASLNFAQFWDGRRAQTLAEQVHGPVHNPVEMGSSWPEVTGKLSRDAQLNEEFEARFADGLTPRKYRYGNCRLRVRADDAGFAVRPLPVGRLVGDFGVRGKRVRTFCRSGLRFLPPGS